MVERGRYRAKVGAGGWRKQDEGKERGGGEGDIEQQKGVGRRSRSRSTAWVEE
jgi:hypothetical protein